MALPDAESFSCDFIQIGRKRGGVFPLRSSELKTYAYLYVQIHKFRILYIIYIYICNIYMYIYTRNIHKTRSH